MQYTDFGKFMSALESGKLAGVILWRGESLIDGAPIVLVASKFAADSANDKTGAMVQTFILPDPHAAGIECNGSRPAKINAWLAATGGKSICGDCPHAWQFDAASGQYRKGPCYVIEYQSPASTLGAVYRNSYPVAGVDFPAAWIGKLGAGQDIRAGSYGDPAAVPADVWHAFLERARTRTGYTHMWKSAHEGARRNAFRLRGVLMASCDSAADLRAARDAGFRSFVVTAAGNVAPIDGAMLCPASDEFETMHGRKTQCIKCGACSGAGGKGARMPDIFIPAHGAGAGKVQGDACPAAARMLESMGA